MWELWEGVERLWLLAGEEKGSGGGLKTEYISLLSKLVGVREKSHAIDMHSNRSEHILFAYVCLLRRRLWRGQCLPTAGRQRGKKKRGHRTL